MRRVILESPFAGDVEGNIRYARRCVRDALGRGEAPIASHLLYTQQGILNDDLPTERQWGIDAGLAWGDVAEATVVYLDRGLSKGMIYGIQNAQKAGRPVELRYIDHKLILSTDIEEDARFPVSEHYTKTVSAEGRRRMLKEALRDLEVRGMETDKLYNPPR